MIATPLKASFALACLALGATTLGACGGGGDTNAGAPATVTVTSTTTPPTSSSSSSTSDPSSATATVTQTQVVTPTGATSGGTTEPAGQDQAASGLPTCQPSQMNVRVQAVAGGASAGHRELEVVASNTGSAQCVTQGYPGLSLVAPDTGKQLGPAADRVSGASAPLLRIEPGKTVTAVFQLAQAADYGASCGQTQAAGFRVYLPGTTAAAYAPYPVTACTSSSIHLLSVKPFSVG